MAPSVLLERLRDVDVAGFRLINGSLRSGFLDFLMPLITDKWNFTLPLGLLVMYVFLYRPRRDLIMALAAVGVLLLADLSTYLLKDLFHRIRPCHALQQVYLLKGSTCVNTFSFPSNHASNMFAIAAFFSYTYRQLMIPCFIGAALIGYSRIYLGVHYPTDVIAGLIWGLLVGFAAAPVAQRLARAGKVNEAVQTSEEDRPASCRNPSQ